MVNLELTQDEFQIVRLGVATLLGKNISVENPEALKTLIEKFTFHLRTMKLKELPREPEALDQEHE